MQLTGETQEIPVSDGDRPGLGVGWTVQVRPFQTSARVPADWPTAVQCDAAAQETPLKTPPAPGVFWIFQLLPFQCSASAAVSVKPTAVQSVPEKQDTPLSQVNPPPRPGIFWIFQVLPFQCSASGVLFGLAGDP